MNRAAEGEDDLKMELFYGKPAGYSFDEILDQYRSRDLNSVRTSTVPLLSYWKSTNQAARDLRKALNLPAPPSTIAFEYPTPSAGRNKSSMTDLMVLGNGWKVAIEAKYTEVATGHQTVAKWNEGRSENKSQVLLHWLRMIAPYSETNLDEEAVQDLPYQFIHRTASACHNSPKSAFVVYEVFYDSTTEPQMQLFIDGLRHAVKTLNPKPSLKFAVHMIEANLTSAGQTIELDSILQTLKHNELYTFGATRWSSLLE